MRRISTLFEIILSAALLTFGLYALLEGNTNKSGGAEAMLVLGAACFTLGATILVSAFRSILWHRHMLRHSVANHHLHGVGPKHHHG